MFHCIRKVLQAHHVPSLTDRKDEAGSTAVVAWNKHQNANKLLGVIV